jgi:hypothetical protein
MTKSIVVSFYILFVLVCSNVDSLTYDVFVAIDPPVLEPENITKI